MSDQLPMSSQTTSEDTQQCHFFAGIAVWSYALRLAGWPDDRPVWTGSCPCPSFSCAGKGQGFDDPRHLWPDWARLIRERKPPVIFGEQSDDAIGYGWLDLVQTDLEAADYAVGKAVLGSASVGASDIRQRLYWLADRAHGITRMRRIRQLGTARRSAIDTTNSRDRFTWPAGRHRWRGIRGQRNTTRPGTRTARARR
jgi:site-specific DNA-cytosine methylase